MSVINFKKTDEYGEATIYDGVISKVCTLADILDDILRKSCNGDLIIVGECTYEMKRYEIVGQIPESLLKRKVSGVTVKSDWISIVKVFLFDEDKHENLDSVEAFAEDLRKDLMQVLEKYEEKIGHPLYSIRVSKSEHDTEFRSTFYKGVEHFSISV